MKRTALILLAMFSSSGFGGISLYTPIKSVEAYLTDGTRFSIHNLSTQSVVFSVFSERLEVPAGAGVAVDCLGYELIAVDVVGEEHPYYELPCSSRLVVAKEYGVGK